jgi:two-component system NtrC family sensor kinase
MRLAGRITTVLVVCILLLLIGAEYLTMRHENEHMNREMQFEANQLGIVISEIIDEFWQSAGPDRAKAILREIDRISSRRTIRLVYLDVSDGDPDCPHIPDRIVFPDGVGSFPCSDETGQEVLFTYARFSIESRPAAIELSERVNHKENNTSFFMMHAAVLMLSTALLGGVLVVALGAAWVGRPLRLLIDKTRRIGRGDLSAPLHLPRRDEFGELADALNAMCEQLGEAQERIRSEATARVAVLDQLRHADRLRTVGRLAAGIAHEVGTPLSVVGGRAGLIASGQLSDEQVRESALIVKSEADRIANIIRQLLDFARRNTPQRKKVDLVHLIRQTMELITPIAEKHGSSLSLLDPPPTAYVRADAGQLQQVLTNLLVNAVESMPNGGALEIGVLRQRVTPPQDVDAQPGEYLRIDVRDQGEGIRQEDLEHLFEPFFTTKEVGQGTGLGLSIVYGIVQEHGGWIDVTTELGSGSCFTVYLPTEVEECRDES